MRLHPLLLVVPLLLGAAACGSDEEETAAPPAPTTSAAPTSGAPSTGSKVLIGTLGKPGDPDDFSIGLTTEDGTKVESLPAGSYTLKVDDQTVVHNFHLSGEGVDAETGVSAKEAKSFEITLKAGKYEYVCDPHSDSMSGSFTVT